MKHHIQCILVFNLINFFYHVTPPHPQCSLSFEKDRHIYVNKHFPFVDRCKVTTTVEIYLHYLLIKHLKLIFCKTIPKNDVN